MGRTDSNPTPSMLVVGKLSLVLGTEQRTKALASKCQILRNRLKKGERRKRPPPSWPLRSTGASLGRQSNQAAHKRQWHHRRSACVGMLLMAAGHAIYFSGLTNHKATYQEILPFLN